MEGESLPTTYLDFLCQISSKINECRSEISLGISVWPSSCGFEGSRANRSVMENMNFCRGADLGSPLTLNCCCLILVSWKWTSLQSHILLEEDIAVRGEARTVPFHSWMTSEDRITNGFLWCSAWTWGLPLFLFFYFRSFYSCLFCLRFPRKKILLTLKVLMNFIRHLP